MERQETQELRRSSQATGSSFNGETPIELEKTNTAPSARSRTNLDRTFTTALDRIRSRRPVPPFSHPLAKEPTTVDVIVEFDGPDDPYRPVNWPLKKKIITTVLYGLTTMTATFASAVFSPGIQQISQDFDISTEVATIGLSLLLLGFGLGPLLWAPLSEVYGRKSAVILPCFLSGIFAFGTATAKDVQTVMLTRFFAGFFGSAPITNTGGVLGDLYPPESRGGAMVGYAMAVVGGPTLGPMSVLQCNVGPNSELTMMQSGRSDCDKLSSVAMDGIRKHLRYSAPRSK